MSDDSVTQQMYTTSQNSYNKVKKEEIEKKSWLYGFITISSRRVQTAAETEKPAN